jgi:hypothetical protein
MSKQIVQQKAKDSSWIDESDLSVPYKYVSPADRLRERHAGQIIKNAHIINTKLIAFKAMVAQKCEEVYDRTMAELDADPSKARKGNFTWFNFNRSIKIEINISEAITFDDLTITAAKSKLDEFLEREITSKNEFAKQMIIDAFETQRSGKLDPKSIMKLTSYEKKIKDPLFSEAVELINQSIRRPKSKTYFRVWIKDDTGKYANIDLNFSSI